ncbi:MAG: hypothetical protein ABI391_01220 [Hyphomicrobiaceae bacterium]
MEIVSWIVWLLAAVAGWLWAIAWLLLGGWVSTLAQILVIVFIVFGFKYGWRRAPLEIALRVRPVAGWLWRWATSREPRAASDPARGAPDIRVIRVKAFGDVNLSTLLNVMMLAGLALLPGL